MIEVNLGPRKDTFGSQSFFSFLDHVNCYQHVQHLAYGKDLVKFSTDDNGIPVYDIFELFNSTSIKYKEINIISVETYKQFKSIAPRLDSSKKYIIFSESYWDTKKHQFDFDYELIYMPWDLVDCQNRLANRSNLYFHLIDLDFLYRYKPRYDFLCLVGRSKMWRDQFVEKLLNKLDISNSLTSYYGKCLGSKDLLNIDIPYDRSNSKFEFENKFYQSINIPETNLRYNLSYFTKNDLFYSTNFSVVVETEAELEEYHITEKTIKCLILGHPFVVMGTPGYLKFLHKLGLTTFSEIFDEHYDDILDLDERMDAVIELVQQLQTKVFDVDQLRDIQNKNLNALIRLRSTQTYEKFLGLFDV